jgi:uncharacterized protein (DUF488 family)
VARADRGIRAGSGRLKRAFTVGHGTLPAGEFVALLRNAGIEAIADVRTVPRSRANPQFESATMATWLREAGIHYEHFKALGGWRRPRADSPNFVLRHPAFRGYADYMLEPEFAAAVDELEMLLAAKTTAVMCSESVWWKCHRRLLADYLALVRGYEVLDLMHDGRADVHKLTPGVRRAPDSVCYDKA